jgi:hypothetical protein
MPYEEKEYRSSRPRPHPPSHTHDNKRVQKDRNRKRRRLKQREISCLEVHSEIANWEDEQNGNPKMLSSTTREAAGLTARTTIQGTEGLDTQKRGRIVTNTRLVHDSEYNGICDMMGNHTHNPR